MLIQTNTEGTDSDPEVIIRVCYLGKVSPRSRPCFMSSGRVASQPSISSHWGSSAESTRVCAGPRGTVRGIVRGVVRGIVRGIVDWGLRRCEGQGAPRWWCNNTCGQYGQDYDQGQHQGLRASNMG